MRRNRAVLVALPFALIAVFAMTSCGGFFVSQDAVNSVSVTPRGVILKTGETVSLTASANLVNGTQSDVTSTATWTSANGDVASVDNSSSKGKVTAGSTATSTTITAQDPSSKESGSSTILVTTGTVPSTLTVQGNTILTSGSSTPFTATVTINGVATNVSSMVTWSSSTTAATVDANGNVTGAAQCGGLISTTACPVITAQIATATSTISGTLQIQTIQ